MSKVKPKRGDTREDGYRFHSFSRNRSGGVYERWYSPEAWERDKVARRISNKAWRKANSERHIAYSTAWNRGNPRRRQAICRAYYEANSEQCRGRNKAWRDANRGKVNELTKRYRARKIDAAPDYLTPQDFAIMASIYDHSQRVSECLGIKHHVDHIIPLKPKDSSVKGTHEPSNLQVIPATLNCQKSNKLNFQLPLSVAA
jgi:hypothetical protein